MRKLSAKIEEFLMHYEKFCGNIGQILGIFASNFVKFFIFIICENSELQFIEILLRKNSRKKLGKFREILKKIEEKFKQIMEYLKKLSPTCLRNYG